MEENTPLATLVNLLFNQAVLVRFYPISHASMPVSLSVSYRLADEGYE